MATPHRKEKITRVLKRRQKDLTVVVEDITDPHNVSAILRTCDAVGVWAVHLVYHSQKFPDLSSKSSSSALKWIKIYRHHSIQECYDSLHEQGFIIGATSLGEQSRGLYELDLLSRTAVVVGNEHTGVSSQAAEKADYIFKIPMMGMVQSLNVSVATAVVLYEAFRQRNIQGKYSAAEGSACSEQHFQQWLENDPFKSER